MRAVLISAFGAALAVAPFCANAAECGPQRISTSVDLMLAGGGGVPIAPVTLAGQQKRMIIDTGAGVPMLFRPAVRQLGLQMGVSSVGALMVDGTLSTGITTVPELILG